MPPTLNVYFLPQAVPAASTESISDGCVIVIDVLRATTTIAQALAAGASRLWPCSTVEQARARSADLAGQGGRPLLAGERHCIRVDGFDLGNSPSEYTASAVTDREIVFTTTNGTAAMLRCKRARQIVLAAFTNLSAVVRFLNAEPQEPAIHIVCAGTNGDTTREDVLLAGALVDRLSRGALVGPDSACDGREIHGDTRLNDASRIARAAWRELDITDSSPASCERLAKAFESTLGGRNLIEIGATHDLTAAAQIDGLEIVPEFVAAAGQIVRYRDQ